MEFIKNINVGGLQVPIYRDVLFIPNITEYRVTWKRYELVEPYSIYDGVIPDLYSRLVDCDEFIRADRMIHIPVAVIVGGYDDYEYLEEFVCRSFLKKNPL